jgi:lysophospholipase L1-like esterase
VIRRLVVAGVALAACLGLVVLVLGHVPAWRRAGGAASARTTGGVTVVGLGDSVMAGSHCGCSGVAAQFATAWGHRLGRTVRAVNLGVPDDTTTTLRKRLDSDGRTRADLRRADLVLVIEGANDLVPQLETWRVGTCDADCYRPAVDLMGQRLRGALADIRRLAPGAQVVVAGYWNVFPDGQTARTEGGQDLIDWSRRITRDANAAIEQAARPERATYVDLTAPFLADGQKDPTALLAEDGDHPNKAGVRAIVTTLLRVTHPPAQPHAG